MVLKYSGDFNASFKYSLVSVNVFPDPAEDL